MKVTKIENYSSVCFAKWSLVSENVTVSIKQIHIEKTQKLEKYCYKYNL